MRVEFADGTVRYGLYNGTIDVPCARLFDTQEEAWAAYDLDSDYGPEGEPVWITADYGSGISWQGRVLDGRVQYEDGFADAQT